MGNQDQYGVDLSALDEVVTKLNRVLGDMGGPRRKAANSTYLPEGTLGKDFSEEKELRDAHDTMKGYIDTKILGLLEDLIDDFGKKTVKTKEAYDDVEHDNTMYT